MQLDLVYSENVEFSHSGSTPIYISGYRTEVTLDPMDEFDESDDDEEEVSVAAGAGGVFELVFGLDYEQS